MSACLQSEDEASHWDSVASQVLCHNLAAGGPGTSPASLGYLSHMAGALQGLSLCGSSPGAGPMGPLAHLAASAPTMHGVPGMAALMGGAFKHEVGDGHSRA